MSDGAKNFTLRLSVEDQARLSLLSERMNMDRTGVLRTLLQGTVPPLQAGDSGVFTSVALRSAISRHSLPVRMRIGGKCE